MAQSNDAGSNNWRSSLKSKALYILENDHLSDITVYIGKEATEFRAHRLLLALASPVLEKELSSFTVDSRLVFRIREISPDQFRKLLRYMYTDEIELESIFEAQELFHAAQKFEMDQLEQICFEYMDERKVDPANACRIYETAFDQKIEGVMQMCQHTFMMETKDVLRSSAFLNSKITTVEYILKMDCLNIDSEVDVIEAVMKWVCAACLSRKAEDTSDNVRKIMLPLLRHIRFLTLDRDQFHNFIVNHDVLSAAEACAITTRMLQPNTLIPYPETICPINCKRQKPETLSKYFAASQSKRKPPIVVSNNLSEIRRAAETNMKSGESHHNTSPATSIGGQQQSSAVQNGCIPKNISVKSKTVAGTECLQSTGGTQCSQSTELARMSMQCMKQTVSGATVENLASAVGNLDLNTRVKSSFAMEFEHLMSKNQEMGAIARNALAEVMKSNTIASENRVAIVDPLLSQEPAASTRNFPDNANIASTSGEIVNESSHTSFEDSSGEEDYEDTQDLTGLKTCDIELDTETELPDGARASDISSDADISILIGCVKLVGLEFYMNVAGIVGSLRILIQVEDGKNFYEWSHDVMELNYFLLPEKVLLRDKQKVHVRVIAENLQLKRCARTLVSEIELKDTDDDKPIEFTVNLYGNQKLPDKNTLYIIKRILYKPWYE